MLLLNSTTVYSNTIIIHVLKANYDAWDEDIAMVNIFFGKETVLGKGSPFLKNGPFKWVGQPEVVLADLKKYCAKKKRTVFHHFAT